MPRILTRPLFRKGGLSRETGIMSGLDSPRRSYAGGGNIGGGRFTGTPMGSRTGFQTTIGPQLSDIDRWKQRIRGTSGGLWDAIKNKLRTTGTQSGSKIVSDAASKVSKMRWPWLSEKGLLEAGKKVAGKGAGIASGFAQRFPKFGGPVTALSLLGIKSGLIKPTEAEEEYGVKHWEKALASSLPGAGGEHLPAIIRKTLGLKKKEDVPEEKIIESDIDTPITGDMESDLMRAYKEYAPIFEKELGVSPDDTKKQLWMQLAKFGAGLAAQPGGDLVGAIGKAAEKPLEGAEKVVSDVSIAKRQAKLLALQTAIKEGEAGPIGKAIKDIAKIYNVSKKEAAGIYEKWQRNDTTARAATNQRYAEQAVKLNLVKDNQNRYIAEANRLETDYRELIGQFNEGLPEEKDEWELGYYVSDTGKFVRVVEKDKKKVAIGMDDPGFSDKKKTKK